MHVQRNDQPYKQAWPRAAESGFKNAEAYVEDVLAHDLSNELDSDTENLNPLFTPERIAEIDAAAAEIRDGKFFTNDQVRKQFQYRRI